MVGSFLLMHRVHALWSYYRKGRIYANPENFGALLAGHALHRLARDRLLIKVAAQCVLIAARITACAEQYRTCYRAYRSLSDAFHGTYPLLISRDASFYRLRKTAYRMQEIAKCALQLLVEVFQLSMCYMDALAALSFSAETQDDAIKELFCNSIRFVDSLANNKQQLLTELKKNEALIATILHPFPKYSVQILIGAVSRSLEGAEWVSKKSRESSLINKTKEVMYDFLLMLDISAPYFPYPEITAPSSRFPPHELIKFSTL